jgi:hypothetical protein
MKHSTKRRIIILPQYVKTPSPKGFQALRGCLRIFETAPQGLSVTSEEKTRQIVGSQPWMSIHG